MRAMGFLRGWNRLTLIGWLVTPPAVVSTYFAMWAGISVHGPASASYWPYLGGLLVLVGCGVLGALALFGIGGRDERALGCLASGLLVPVGGLALWALIYHLTRYGLPD